MLKTNPWEYKIKDLNGETICGSFYKKKLLLSKLWKSHYPGLDSHITDKVKIVLSLQNYASKKKLNEATGVDTSNSSAKSDFIALKAEVEGLDINEFVSVSTGFKKLKTKVNDLNVDKLKTVSVDLKKISDAVVKKKLLKRQFITN